MLDSGFIGHFPVGGTVPLLLQGRNTDLSVGAPDGNTASYKIINPSGSAVKTGTITTTISGLTGVLFGTLELSNANTFQAGSVYTIVFSYNNAFTARSSISTFQVV